MSFIVCLNRKEIDYINILSVSTNKCFLSSILIVHIEHYFN